MCFNSSILDRRPTHGILVLFAFVRFKCSILYVFFFFFKQKTAYEINFGDWSSDVSSDLGIALSRQNAIAVASITLRSSVMTSM